MTITPAGGSFVLPNPEQLRTHLAVVIADRKREGHDVQAFQAELETCRTLDALNDLAGRIARAPLRDDWPYHEPDDLEGIWAACDPARPLGPIHRLEPSEAAARIETAFLARACGCTLGKPFEVHPTLADIRAALETVGEWPLSGYVSARTVKLLHENLGKTPPRDAESAVREGLRFVPPDDDLNYTILGMLVLERHGAGFTRHDVLRLWLEHLPPLYTFGPERVMLARAASHTAPFSREMPIDATLDDWLEVWNPNAELCGAMIRADAYAYACPGHPALAAEFAWRDAHLTHRRTCVYGAMFAAAAIATAFVVRDPLEVFQVALGFVPQKSRLQTVLTESLKTVWDASDWLEAYERIHAHHRAHGHCQIYQESATLMNTLRFATDIGDGLCKQVMQGNDTDSYGATIGSILGAYFGPGHLEGCWLEPLRDEIRTALAGFPERSLSALAVRMSQLPNRVTTFVSNPA
jgi:hypothetical protein